MTVGFRARCSRIHPYRRRDGEGRTECVWKESPQILRRGGGGEGKLKPSTVSDCVLPLHRGKDAASARSNACRGPSGHAQPSKKTLERRSGGAGRLFEWDLDRGGTSDAKCDEQMVSEVDRSES